MCQVCTGIVAAIRAEKGNLRYEYFYPRDDDETVLLIDSWEDREALDAHHKSHMMSEIIKLREKHGLHMKVEQYISAEETADNKSFIRE